MYELQGSLAMLSVDPSKGGRNPHGGKAFFVNETSGDNDHEGSDPQFPLKDLVTAYGKCADGKGDYIFSQYFSTLSAPPLLIAKRRLHIIGLGSGNFDSSNDLNGGNAAAALRLVAGGRDLELAGFNIGGDGTGYGIEVEAGETAYRCHIHHCTIGNNFGVTDGIHAAEMSNMSIDHCLFGGAATGHHMDVSGSVMLIIAHNIFHNIAAGKKAIYLSLGAVMDFILGNCFMSRVSLALANGWAIDLPAGGYGSMIIGNRAADCGDDTGNEPYVDRSGTGVGDLANGWSDNWGSEQSANGQIPPLHV